MTPTNRTLATPVDARRLARNSQRIRRYPQGGGIVGNMGRGGLGFVPWGTIAGGIFDGLTQLWGGSDTRQYDPILEAAWSAVHQTTGELIARKEAGQLTRADFQTGVDLLYQIQRQFAQNATAIEPPSDPGRGQRDAGDMKRAIDAWVRDRQGWYSSLPVSTAPGGNGGTDRPPVVQTAGFGGDNMTGLLIAGAALLLLPGLLKGR